MFKHYLTYQFANGFERDCSLLELPTPHRNELVRCCRSMLLHLYKALQTSDKVEGSKCLFVALTYLHDCRDVLDTAGKFLNEIKGKYEVLNLRLEKLCEDASVSAEDGQLRMLG
jgi:hypothetical protein